MVANIRVPRFELTQEDYNLLLPYFGSIIDIARITPSPRSNYNFNNNSFRFNDYYHNNVTEMFDLSGMDFYDLDTVRNYLGFRAHDDLEQQIGITQDNIIIIID